MHKWTVSRTVDLYLHSLLEIVKPQELEAVGGEEVISTTGGLFAAVLSTLNSSDLPARPLMGSPPPLVATGVTRILTVSTCEVRATESATEFHLKVYDIPVVSVARPDTGWPPGARVQEANREPLSENSTITSTGRSLRS